MGGPGRWLPPAVLDELNVGVAQLAQALFQVLAEAAQGHLDDVDIAEQLPVQSAAEGRQPGGYRRQGGDPGPGGRPGGWREP